MKIMEICESERPREKMLSMGPEALGNAELLAILLRTGTREESALDLAQRLLKMTEGSLVRLYELGATRLCAVSGIGSYKACGVLAAFELGRRFLQEGAPVSKRPLLTPRMIYDLMLPVLKGLRREEFWLISLNASSYLAGRDRLTVGGSTSTVIDAKQVISLALERGAESLVLVHNHPSGNPRPSQADIDQTRRIKQACGTLGIRLSDHLVFCDDAFFSFADDRLYMVGQ